MLSIREVRPSHIVYLLCSVLLCSIAVADDFGDAPASYGDPSHVDGTFEWFGYLSGDSEAGTQYSPDATGDDTAGIHDEDGVQLVWDSVNGTWAVDVRISVADRSAFTLGVGYRYENPGLGGGDQRWLYVNAWWDADESGTFDAAERFVGAAYNPRQGIPIGPAAHPAWTSNSQTYRYPIPAPYVPRAEGDFFRFRLTYGGAIASLPGVDLSQPFGEVEDRMFTPEPASLALLGFGMVALAQRRRKKK